MGDNWRRGGENNIVWREVSKWCADTERQEMEANMRENRSQVLHSDLKKVIGKEKIIQKSVPSGKEEVWDGGRWTYGDWKG
jgi:hypothetical protein